LALAVLRLCSLQGKRSNAKNRILQHDLLQVSMAGKGFITDGEDIICPDCAKERLMNGGSSNNGNATSAAS